MRAVELPGSNHAVPAGAQLIRDLHYDAPVSVSVYLESQSEGFDRLKALAAFRRLAIRHNLSMGMGPCPNSIRLSGIHRHMSRAFGTRLRIYHDGRRRFHARSGPLLIARELAAWTRSVLGFDDRSMDSQPRLRPQADSVGCPSMWPTDIARLYGISPQEDASGQCLAIIALGGGYLPDDVAAAAHAAGHPAPLLVECPVNGVGNLFGSDTRADQELALDLQVAAALAPAARIAVYFAAANQDSFVAAINAAVSDEVNRPSVISISWGSAESFWKSDQLATAEAAFSDAVRKKISVVAAAGDALATAGLTDGAAHVLYPASSSMVLACGGTEIKLDSTGGAIQDESVWNDGLQGTGGGISDKFDVPPYQTNTVMPVSPKDGKGRRGVPDVAALASPKPGYRVIVGNEPLAMLGTSASTPLWAAIIARANSRRGVRLGPVHKGLYLVPSLCRQVTRGNNRSQGIGFDAGHDWNACAGWGVPTSGTVEGLAGFPLDEDLNGVTHVT